jgi:hypothetical protein
VGSFYNWLSPVPEEAKVRLCPILFSASTNVDILCPPLNRIIVDIKILLFSIELHRC